MSQSIYDIPVKIISGQETRLAAYKGKVLLIVNVASKCGLTPQYEGLEKLYQAQREQGLEILAFPANNFKGQEPGTDEEIQQFCSLNYNVSFPLFSKISVVGEDQHPLYSYLTQTQPTRIGGEDFAERLSGFGNTPNELPDVLWNFEKFLVNKNGDVVGRFAPNITSDDSRLLEAISAELAK